MSAYVIVHAVIKDAEKMKQYGAGAGPTVKSHDGEVVSRGPYQVLAGQRPVDGTGEPMMVVLKFPSKKAAEDWYNSPEYQAVIPIRQQAMDATFTLVGE